MAKHADQAREFRATAASTTSALRRTPWPTTWTASSNALMLLDDLPALNDASDNDREVRARRRLFVAIARGVVRPPAATTRTLQGRPARTMTSTTGPGRRCGSSMIRPDAGLPRFPVRDRRARAQRADDERRPHPRPDPAGAVHRAGRARQPAGIRLRPQAARLRAGLRRAGRGDRAARPRRADPLARPGDLGRAGRGHGDEAPARDHRRLCARATPASGARRSSGDPVAA